jgi:hypothetical protein
VHRRPKVQGVRGAAVSLYSVTFDCPRCCKPHLVSSGLVLEPRPDHAGTVAELWPRGNYPPAVAGLLRDWVWCDLVGEYIAMRAERVIVIPSGKTETDNAEGQPDQSGDLDAGEGVEGPTSS